MEEQMRFSHAALRPDFRDPGHEPVPDLTNTMRRIADHTLLIVKNMSGISGKPP